MLSLHLHDQPAPAPQQRWLRGVTLSLVVHALAITAIVVQARQRHHWEAGPSATGAAVDLTRAGNTEGVTVGLSDRMPPSADVLPLLEEGGELPARAQPLPATGTPGSSAPARTAASPSSRGPGPAVRGSRGGRLAASDNIAGPPALTPALPIPAPPRPAPDPARAAFRAQLRRHLHDAWHANEVFTRIDPQGRLDGSLFTTGIQVRLRADGTIERADLAESSGIAALDKEALGTLTRIEPLPPVPPTMLDAQGGWTVLCKFYLDVGLFRFAAEIRRAITEKWRPSRAFAVTAEQERKTVLRFVLNSDGTLVNAGVVQSSGLDFLDNNALAMAQPGLRLPAPPPAFMRQPGPANVFVAFLHQAGDVRVLKPREDVEDQ
jgi:TonB family protein